MVDLIEVLAFGVIGFVSGTLVMLYAVYRLEKANFFENVVENVLNDVANNEELQQNIYKVGGILGQGLKGGFGIDTPSKNRGGRFRWQDMILQLGGEYLKNTMLNPSPSLSAPLTSSPSQDISTKKLSDRW